MARETRLREVQLDDKYVQGEGRVFATGIQALVRLPMEQRRRDLAAGRNTAGYVSGYRGSPLGTYDQQLARAKRLLEEHHIVAQPQINEDLAATALAGTQQAGLDGMGRYDGVFGIWYGKGPGVDRSGDAIRHGNLFGTSPLGGVLALLGDDHTCESSTTAHQSEYAMVDAMVPVLNPSGVQEILDYGLYGIAMSRYSGAWTALKCVHDTVEATASIAVGRDRARICLPDDYEPPPDGLHVRWPDGPLEQEERLHRHKLVAARAFVRANGLDRVIFGARDARIGIVTAGKAYQDVREALDELGLTPDRAERLGLRLFKPAVTWPLEPRALEAACAGLDLVIVVEEKRGLIEQQVKEQLYGTRNAPVVIGKTDTFGAPLFPSWGMLSVTRIAGTIARHVLERREDEELRTRLAEVEARERRVDEPPPIVRLPYFCSGCPHSTSTRVPEGSAGRAGIGCHFLAQYMDRSTAGFTQMGGEGGSWIGEAPFTKRPHVFQNVGDGTYTHSGSLAVRAAVASRVNVTFKILYNDAVAMTGGQKPEGGLTVPMIARQLEAEGVERIAVVTDEPHKYPLGAAFPHGVQVHHRDELDEVQRTLREIEGVTAIIYDQTCAAEKRRRRKRGTFPDPQTRVYINEEVCEGCGDCGVQSNCVAIAPVETELGRKRAIDQSACNKDFSCLKGFCPSFVTVHGAEPRKTRRQEAAGLPAPPEPDLPALDRPYGILIGGVGGTGVVTIGALIGMAAHLEGKGCAILDMIGLAQKGGAVLSHLKVSGSPEAVTSSRIARGGASLLLGCDLVVSASTPALATATRDATRAIVNSQQVMTGDFTRNPDLDFPAERLGRMVEDAVGPGRAAFVDAGRIATALLGDAIAANLFLLGHAYQQGLVPVSADAIEKAIELNGVAVAMNRDAFRLGRTFAHDPASIERLLPEPPRPVTRSLDELIEDRARRLVGYQNEAYAARYRALVERMRKAERERMGGEALTTAVARYYYKLLAYKDEYEVARLYTDGGFERRLREQFEGNPKLEVHLAPPLLAEIDQRTGRPKKRAYGRWMFRAFRVLAGLRRLRGTALDPFGYSAERRRERALIAEYEGDVEEVLKLLDPERSEAALEVLRLPEQIRGFGPVKEASIERAEARRVQLLLALRDPQPARAAAE